jgi:predicted nucleic acid-binding Zn ribbon protein
VPKSTPALEVSPEAARALVVGSCPACGGSLTSRQTACSGRCRAAISRRRQEQVRRDRDARVASLLLEAVRLLERGGT